MPAVQTGELLSTSAASHLAGVSAVTIRAWVRDGRLPAQTTPLGALIQRSDLDRSLPSGAPGDRARREGAGD